MDLTKIDISQVMTALNFLALILFGISDIRKRRAEATAKLAESKKIDTDAADRITESALKMLEPKDKQIEQQNNQILRLLSENQQLSTRFSNLQIAFDALQKDFDTIKTVLLQKESEYNKMLLRLGCFEKKLKEGKLNFEDCK